MNVYPNPDELTAYYIVMNSEGFSFEPLGTYVVETFLALSSLSKILAKNPLFEVISLHGPTRP
jgi:hypothetical protein